MDDKLEDSASSRRQAIAAVVFVLTGLAMTYGLPWTNPDKFAVPIPEPILFAKTLFASEAPLYAQLSFVLLPMLFGMAVAAALRLGSARVALGAVSSGLLYQGLFITITLAFNRVKVDGAIALWLSLAALAASVGGALGMFAAVTDWRRVTRRAVMVLTAASVVPIVAVGILYVLQIGPLGVRWLGQRGMLAAGFALWQLLVGTAVVTEASPAAKTTWDRFPRGMLCVAGLAVVAIAGGSWTRAHAPIEPGTLRVNSVEGSAMYAWVPPGQFEMGCSRDDDECAEDEAPIHTVRLSQGFWLRTREVTVADWKARLQRTASTSGPWVPPLPAQPPSESPGSRVMVGLGTDPDERPITNVTWSEARTYCASVRGRLPTEAEWEYGARAGTTGARYGRLREIARFGHGPSGSSESNGSSAAERLFGDIPHSSYVTGNSWRLDNMLGNVAEWVEDDYAESTYQLRDNEQSPADAPAHHTGFTGGPKVVRGGSWASQPADVRASARGHQPPDERTEFIGVRCIWNGDDE